MRFAEFFAIIAIFGLLGLGWYLLWNYLPGESQQLSRLFPADSVNVTPLSSTYQFYPNMRYSDSRITYKIDDLCDHKKNNDALEAFSTLADYTLLEFVPVENDPEIDIICSEVAPTSEQANHFIAGEGGPSNIINVSSFYVILRGKISLYRSETCDSPHIALHEILHALGFDHNPNPQSMMFEIVNCKQSLDSHIIDEINRLYETPSEADISFEEVTATKSGRYLSFYAEVMNRGLVDARDVTLEVLENDEVIRRFVLDDVPLGTKKFLDVSNLPVSRGTEEVELVLTTGDGELSLENNRAVLVVS